MTPLTLDLTELQALFSWSKIPAFKAENVEKDTMSVLQAVL